MSEDKKRDSYEVQHIPFKSVTSGWQITRTHAGGSGNAYIYKNGEGDTYRLNIAGLGFRVPGMPTNTLREWQMITEEDVRAILETMRGWVITNSDYKIRALEVRDGYRDRLIGWAYRAGDVVWGIEVDVPAWREV